ncbi:MAG: hypothetical protein DRP64_20465 [Verrucomicrobia bacterium]|nr:MAG: hypothetical protein DRP64_20465 [Verrucomicrobiota bacterium]
MKKKIPILITALSLIVAIGGLSFGVSASIRRKAAEEEANHLRMQMAAKQAAVPVADTTPLTPYLEPSIDTNALTELEAELAALRAELAAAKEQPPQRESWEDRMARMKEEDPEGYAEMIKNRTERRDAMRYDLAERTANFMELDTAFMTGAERENHELLIEKMADVWALTEQFNDPEQQPNREAMRELFGAINEARPLMDAERGTMFRQLANDLGYDGEEAQAFSGYVEDIISTTTIQPPRGGRRGP